MPRSLLSTRPHASHGIHRFRNMRLRYNGELLSGLHIIINLRSLGLKTPAILTYLERLERREAKRNLISLVCSTKYIQ